MENCRVCRETHHSFIILSQENKKKFFQITGIELDEMSKENLCEKCYEELLLAWNFRVKAIATDEWYQEQQKKIDEKETKIEVYVDEGSSTISIDTTLKNELTNEVEVKEKVPKCYICYFCEEKFKQYLKLRAHMREHKRQRRLICRCCDKAHANRKQLAYHERSIRRKQLQSSSYVCQHCGNIYNDIKSLAMHGRVHSDKKPLKCTIEGCNEAFREKRAYYSHFPIAHGIKRPCFCVDCGTSYINHISLRFE